MNIYLAFAVAIIAKTLFESFLENLNKSYYENKENQDMLLKPLDISAESFSKTLKYTQDKFTFNMSSLWITTFTMLIFIFLGGFGYLEHLAMQISLANPNSLVTGVVFFLLLMLVTSVFQIPFSYYSIFNIEDKHGFNKQDRKTFFIDQIKSLIISSVLISVLISLILLSMRMGEYWWLLGWSIYCCFAFVLSWVYPTILAPLFNKFTPLESGELKEQIVQLTKKINFNLDDLYVMDASKRSTHGNAYFTGVFGKKRIVLFDSLINKLNNKEIVAVLAHELGHFKLNHIRKSLFISFASMGIVFYILSLFMGINEIYNAFGFKGQSNHAALVIFSLCFSLIGIITTPILSRFSRKNEFEADFFAHNCFGQSRDLISALCKLSKENHSMPLVHKLYSSFYYSHPPLMERLDALEKLPNRL